VVTDVSDAEPDLGYFGPDSVTWRVHAEPLTMIGGVRALLLQALHPEAMRLMTEQSAMQDDTFARLSRTARYVATVSFAPKSEVDELTALVRSVHHRLGIGDPEQLAWVHACEVDSFLTAARAAGIALTKDECDRYVAEQATAAGFVEVPDSLTPRSTAELAELIDATRPRLRVTREAWVAARYVLVPAMKVPPVWRLPARLGWSTAAGLGVGLLPTWARRAYRLPTLPVPMSLPTSLALRTIRTASTALPLRWRQGPQYQAALRRAIA
jgi:uncharacterized protein (DUF2236 family)